jgi:hypothetical protein
MKHLCSFVVVCLLAISAIAQTPAPDNVSNLYAAGLSGNPGATPQIAGTAMYAHLVNDGSGTYAFTVFDALPTTKSPFSVTTNMGVGVAQKLFTIGKVPLFIPTAAGVSFNGTNTGWQWNTGVLASIRLKGNWRVLPNVRVSKSSVSNGTGYQLIPGVLIGWGQ